MSFKIITIIGLTWTTLIANHAFAVAIPNWYRPVKKSEMKVVEAIGAFVQIKEVNMTLQRQDSGKQNQFLVELDGKKIILQVTAIYQNRCGLVKYQASQEETLNGLVSEGYKLILTEKADWSTRCLGETHSDQDFDIRTNALQSWTATLIHEKEFRDFGVLKLHGNTEPVYTPMNQ